MNSQTRSKTPTQPRKAQSLRDREKLLQDRVRQHNEAYAGRGYKFLKSFLSNVVAHPEWGYAKPIYHAINTGRFSDALALSKQLLTQTYETPDEQFRAVACAALIKKYPNVENTKVADENAFRKFLRGERRNRHFNRVLRARRVGHKISGDVKITGLGIDPSPVVEVMRQYIRRTIGDKPRFSGNILSNGGRWGPGANIGVNGRFTNFARKILAEQWTCTPAALPYAITIMKRLPVFWEVLGLTKDRVDQTPIICVDSDEFERRVKLRTVIVDYNGISYAEKDSDCSRTIAKEPLLNQLVQLAVDMEMKLMLRRVGLDLRDQKPNQVMAREGSLDVPNPYCTADLRNASGSVFTELVRELFPPDWFKFLNDIRSPAWRTASDGDTSHKYHGFVSMGNGYCFPLETLIFASICSACHVTTGTTPDFRVYGDDIIIRQNESGLLHEYLRYFGFELNADKSFFFGPFRESCGADWHSGEPVRPVYIHDDLSSLAGRIRVHNALARSNQRWAGFLTSCTRSWWPSFMTDLVCPFPTHTDEAIDGRHICGPTLPTYRNWNKDIQAPRWFGISTTAVADDEIVGHEKYHVALMYGALSGSKSDTPFAERRETRESVTSFSHGGGGSTVLPHESEFFQPIKHRCYYNGPRLEYTLAFLI